MFYPSVKAREYAAEEQLSVITLTTPEVEDDEKPNTDSCATAGRAGFNILARFLRDGVTNVGCARDGKLDCGGEGSPVRLRGSSWLQNQEDDIRKCETPVSLRFFLGGDQGDDEIIARGRKARDLLYLLHLRFSCSQFSFSNKYDIEEIRLITRLRPRQRQH